MTDRDGRDGGVTGGAPERIDGRVLRGQRNRTALMDSLVLLLAEGNLQPRAQQVADRAGVSVRSLFQHFPDLDALYAETAVREGRRVNGVIEALDERLRTLSSTEERLVATVEMRAELWETTMPAPVLFLLRVANRDRERVESVFEGVIMRLRRQLQDTFREELSRLDTDLETATITLQVAMCQELWANLRFNQHRSVEESRAILLRLGRAALTTSTAPIGER